MGLIPQRESHFPVNSKVILVLVTLSSVDGSLDGSRSWQTSPDQLERNFQTFHKEANNKRNNSRVEHRATIDPPLRGLFYLSGRRARFISAINQLSMHAMRQNG